MFRILATHAASGNRDLRVASKVAWRAPLIGYFMLLLLGRIVCTAYRCVFPSVCYFVSTLFRKRLTVDLELLRVSRP